MEYLLFIATDTEPGTSPTVPDIDEWVAEGERRGIRLRGDVLRPLDDATTIRVRDGQVLVTDGPYTESKEWIVGYDLLECEDLDQAIDYVRRHPMAYHGRIEIRPVARSSTSERRRREAVAGTPHRSDWAPHRRRPDPTDGRLGAGRGRHEDAFAAALVRWRSTDPHRTRRPGWRSPPATGPSICCAERPTSGPSWRRHRGRVDGRRRRPAALDLHVLSPGARPRRPRSP